MFELDIRNMDVVTRWSTIRTLHRQDLAQHSYYVAVYADQIARFINVRIPAAVNELDTMRYALWHDVPETSSGDAPGPYKRLTQDHAKADALDARIMEAKFDDLAWMKPLDREMAVVKLAEALDETFYMAIEQRSGNDHIGLVHNDCIIRVRFAVDRLKHLIPSHDDTFEALMDRCLDAANNHKGRTNYKYVLDLDHLAK